MTSFRWKTWAKVGGTGGLLIYWFMFTSKNNNLVWRRDKSNIATQYKWHYEVFLWCYGEHVCSREAEILLDHCEILSAPLLWTRSEWHQQKINTAVQQHKNIKFCLFQEMILLNWIKWKKWATKQDLRMLFLWLKNIYMYRNYWNLRVI